MPFKDPDLRRAYQAEWLRSRRDRGISVLGGACARCGSTDDLEVDHVDPASKDPRLRSATGTGTLWSWSWERVLAELKKCQLLCRKHHLEKTASQDGRWFARRGVHNGNAKLSNKDVLRIRASREPAATLAAEYGVHRVTIQRIRTATRWKHVHAPLEEGLTRLTLNQENASSNLARSTHHRRHSRAAVDCGPIF